MRRKLLSLLLTLLMCVTITPISSATNVETYANNIQYHYWNGHTYARFDEGLIWTDAEQKCEELGGHLATITTKDEQSFIESLVTEGTQNQYWLGGYENNGWKWVTGESWDYTHWDSGEPNDYRSNEAYLEIYRLTNPKNNGKPLYWNDISVDNHIADEENFFTTDQVGYICEWDKEVSSTTVEPRPEVVDEVRDNKLLTYWSEDIPVSEAARIIYLSKDITRIQLARLLAGLPVLDGDVEDALNSVNQYANEKQNYSDVVVGQDGITSTDVEILKVLSNRKIMFGSDSEDGNENTFESEGKVSSEYISQVIDRYENYTDDGKYKSDYGIDYLDDLVDTEGNKSNLSIGDSMETLVVVAEEHKSSRNIIFPDVSESSPFYRAVQWAVRTGVTVGYSDGTFRPTTTCTNNHILTFLWRSQDTPTSRGSNDFEKAINWAKSKDVASYSTVGDDYCTRALAVSYLWKLAGSPKVTYTGTFVDVPTTSEYASAIAWAVSEGITNGTDSTHFSPDTTCTRGQIVTFLYRAYV